MPQKIDFGHVFVLPKDPETTLKQIEKAIDDAIDDFSMRHRVSSLESSARLVVTIELLEDDASSAV